MAWIQPTTNTTTNKATQNHNLGWVLVLAIAKSTRAIQGAGWRQADSRERRGKPISFYPPANAGREGQN